MLGRPRVRRLVRDLQLRLLLPLLVIVAATGALGVYTSQRLTDRVFDRWLLDAAHSLAQLVRFDGATAKVDLPPAAATMLAYDDTDRTFYSVSQGPRLVIGEPGIPRAGEHLTHYTFGQAFDSRIGGEPVRVVVVPVVDGAGHEASVQVAETLLKRHRVAQELRTLLWPIVVLVLAAGIAIVLAVRRTVSPLSSIAARWNQRSHASLEPIRADDMPGELLPFAEALNDLLARIRALLDRERAFAASAAHQLRTPLAGLQLGLARAAEAPDLAAARQVMAELSQATQRHARLVQQLLILGRLDPEMRGGLEFTPTDLVTLAQNVGAAFADAAHTKQISLELATPAVPVVARLHPDLMAEAIGNLLENAIRYTPQGGRIVISFEPLAPTLVIEDSGVGVPPDQRESVFERFVRGRGASGEGSGLGLAIVRDIAALHGATVTLDSGPLGGCRATWRCAEAPTH